jgi:hypothetical protein
MLGWVRLGQVRLGQVRLVANRSVASVSSLQEADRRLQTHPITGNIIHLNDQEYQDILCLKRLILCNTTILFT